MVPSASALVHLNEKCCIFCEKAHISKKCRVRVKCSKCNGRHNHIIYQKDSDTTQRSVPVQIENLLSNSTFTHVFLQTLKVKLIGVNKNRYSKLIFDTGSQRSYISKCAIAKMEYSPLRIEQMVHSLFGGTITQTVSHTCYRIRVSSFNDKYICNFEALDQQIICNNIPCIKNGPWIDELRSFGVDMLDTVDGSIDILVGADI
ncbi:unnamed protein product [Psylliodes chrysocephalus]|uniref:Peptidase aspartic putative domain-containing protein n=1 Tax=Psylliodes chrysocephalus TaxID=3402493 RepID=A0A9P0GBD0_9CUCU|nr:unnamed protein product [Psylliodes chrysocephala]